MPTVPTTLPSVRLALLETEHEVAVFLESLEPEEFARPMGEAWSPAEHLVHLNKVVSAVARGFMMRPWILGLRFGHARRPSQCYEELCDDYRAALTTGAGSPEPFMPDLEAEPCRDTLLERWARVNSRLREALATWGEREMDRVVMPHPLLGKLTAREMAFFTVYHGVHHIEAMRCRMVEKATAG